MRRRTFEEMITYFNQTVSEMDIDRKYKMTLLGIVTALLQKHDEELAKNSPKVNSDSGESISRKTAIEAMEDVDWYHINKDGQLVHGANSKEDEPLYKAEDVYKVLNDIPSAQPEPQWIPVTKRLPNREEYIRCNGLFIVSDGDRTYAEYFDIYDKKCFGEPVMHGFRADRAVTAWMPLPEPYAERRTNE